MNEVFPLALAMVAGVELVVAVILITSKNNIKSSIAYVSGSFVATVVATSVFYFLANKIHPKSIKALPENFIHIIQVIAVCILILMSIYTFINRKKSKTPKWFVKLEQITPIGAFKLGIMLILLDPGEELIMFTAGLNIYDHAGAYIEVLEFALLVGFLLAVPLLFYLILGRKAQEKMPHVRDWIEKHSWVISIATYVLFIFLILQ